MKYKYNVLVTAFLALWLIIGVTSCSDDSTSDGDTEDNCSALALPSELAPATIAIEYFDVQEVPKDEEHTVYHQVEDIATTGNGLLSFGGSADLITTFLSVAPQFQIEPVAQDGNCVWNIDLAEDFPQFGIDATVTVTASQAGDQVNWQVLYDGELQEQVVEDFLFLDGFTSNDESTGEWNGYDPENPGSPAYTYTWDIESEDSYELNLDVFEQAATVSSVNYVRNGVENDMIFSAEGQANAVLYWNEETDSGWIEPEGGERMCYTDFVNSACS